MRYTQLEGYVDDERESVLEKVMHVCCVKRHVQRRKRATLRVGVVV
jgi:hypothetical protein